MIDFEFNGEPARIVGEQITAEDETLRDLLKMLAEEVLERERGPEIPDVEEWLLKGLERWGRIDVIRREKPESEFDPDVDY